MDTDNLSSVEKIPTKIFETNLIASEFVANKIAELIKKKSELGQKCVLGLATGSTPKLVYKLLIEKYKKGEISFKNVVTFNLDEYFPMSKDSKHSYWSFMHEQLFNHIDIDPQNINIPKGDVDKSQVEEECIKYEQKIVDYGGIDLQILGIGRTGHIAFNEPGSSKKSKTRLIFLDRMTRNDAADGFNGIEFVPRMAITMGISTILEAKQIITMAFTEDKSKIVQQVIEGEASPQIPGTFLQDHKNVLFVVDKSASEKLTRNISPWAIQGIKGEIKIDWDLSTTKRATIWLSLKVKKPILRLTLEDYENNGLYNLVQEVGKGIAGAVNLKVYNEISHTITGWPAGGKPKIEDADYYQRKAVTKKNILIFSPHPDDDVICMGATMRKLTNQGHNVHVCYQTSGNFAVFDSDALRMLDFYNEVSKEFNHNNQDQSQQLFNFADSFVQKKTSSNPDPVELLRVKKLIRRTEARDAALSTGVLRENIHFLDLPFYETGTTKKNPLSQKDIDIVNKTLLTIKPDLIFAAGDLTDPHGTHRVCLQSILNSLDQLKDTDIVKNCQVLLYRGAWQEWELHRVTLSVPISPDEMLEKRLAIFKHQSQKDRPMFPGNDKREFWQRAEFRNMETAGLLYQLGFVQYEGLEVFVDLKVLKQAGDL